MKPLRACPWPSDERGLWVKISSKTKRKGHVLVHRQIGPIDDLTISDDRSGSWLLVLREEQAKFFTLTPTGGLAIP